MTLSYFANCLLGQTLVIEEQKIKVISTIIENGTLVTVIGKNDDAVFFLNRQQDGSYSVDIKYVD